MRTTCRPSLHKSFGVSSTRLSDSSHKCRRAQRCAATADPPQGPPQGPTDTTSQEEPGGHDGWGFFLHWVFDPKRPLCWLAGVFAVASGFAMAMRAFMFDGGMTPFMYSAFYVGVLVVLSIFERLTPILFHYSAVALMICGVHLVTKILCAAMRDEYRRAIAATHGLKSKRRRLWQPWLT